MNALFRTIHDTGPAMETFFRAKNAWNFGSAFQFKNILRTRFQAKLATCAEKAVNLNRHIRSSRGAP
jgi:hypothetical protein